MSATPVIPAPSPTNVADRVLAIDALRGLVMLAMVSHGLGFPRIAKYYAEQGVVSPIWQTLGFQFEHVEWIGISFWDLIQPSFMFLVGVSLAFSVAKRAERGQTFGGMLFHAAWRAAVLILLGVFLRSNTTPQTNWMFTDVTSQIGLGYLFLFLLSFAKSGVQWAAVAVILAGYWGWFAAWPLPSADFDYASVGLPANWPHLSGFEQHWDKNTNAAAAFDTWFMNLWPREKPFLYERGGYQTLNFLPSLATMLLGLLAGEWLRGEPGEERSGVRKVVGLLLAGVMALGLGLIIHELGICPIVKRIWTPSWVIYSAGWVCLLLGAFYGISEELRLRSWAFPLVVAGANSIAIYCMSYLLPPWIDRTLKCHLGGEIFHLQPLASLGLTYGGVPILGESGVPDPFAALVRSVTILIILWLICFWMYRRKLFSKV